MRRVILIHLRRIEGLTQNTLQTLFDDFENFGFSDVSGYGFIETNLDGSKLSSIFVLRKITYRTIFSPETNTFSRQESIYFERVPFFIDLKFDTLEVCSNATNTRRVVSIIGEYLNYQLPIADLGFTPAEILNLFAKSNKPFALKKFTINNFVARPGVSGKYTPEISDNNSGLSVIKGQEADVTKVTLRLNFVVEDDVELSISSSGGLNITCDEDNLIDVLSEIKLLFFGGVL